MNTRTHRNSRTVVSRATHHLNYVPARMKTMDAFNLLLKSDLLIFFVNDDNKTGRGSLLSVFIMFSCNVISSQPSVNNNLKNVLQLFCKQTSMLIGFIHDYAQTQELPRWCIQGNPTFKLCSRAHEDNGCLKSPFEKQSPNI